MAEPISLAASLLALATFGGKASIALYQTIDSFQSHKRNVRELKEELEALSKVLQSLEEHAQSADNKLDVLKLPVLRCGQACEAFRTSIEKSWKSPKTRTGEFCDWARWQYLGSNISQFRDQIAGYKGTITIALADINLRTATVTANVLEQYMKVIQDTTSDLEDQIEQMNAKLEQLRVQSADISSLDEETREQIVEDRDSFQHCLKICESVSAHIEMLTPKLVEIPHETEQKEKNDQTMGGASESARALTAGTLEACTRNLETTSKQLRALQEARARRGTTVSLDLIREEEERTKQALREAQEYLRIVSEAAEPSHMERINVFEDVTVAEDSHQVIVSTFGDLITARRMTIGARSTNWMGQMSDESLQEISRNRAPVSQAERTQQDAVAGFSTRYGVGKSIKQ